MAHSVKRATILGTLCSFTAERTAEIGIEDVKLTLSLKRMNAFLVETFEILRKKF